MRSRGVHHITAMASDAQQNRDFYEGLLGLRLVKITVNFDDPGMYHLYYGDGMGSPGTILTFFPIPGLPKGAPGSGAVTSIALAIPQGATPFWQARCTARGLAVAPLVRDGAQSGIAIRDPDGLTLTLVETEAVVAAAVWEQRVPSSVAIQGVEGIDIASRALTASVAAFDAWLGYAGADGECVGARGTAGGVVRLHDGADLPRARMGAGTVHHIAFRTADAQEQIAWHTHVTMAGGYPTPVQDRDYFTSIYFREPGGVLLEIATDPPGFARDESPEYLGEALRVPEWLAPHLAQIEEHLTPLHPAPMIGGE